MAHLRQGQFGFRANDLGGGGVFISEDYLPERGEVVQCYRISLESNSD